MSTTGPDPVAAPSAVAASGRGSATYSSLPSRMLLGRSERRSRSDSAVRSSGRSVVASTRPSMAKAMSLPVIPFNCVARASSSRKPTPSVPRISGFVLPSAIGTVTSCNTPSGRGSKPTLSASGERFANGRLARCRPGRARRGDGGEHAARLVRHQEQVRIELSRIVLDHFLHRRRVVGVDRSLEQRRVGEDAGHRRERLAARRAQLIDQRAGRAGCRAGARLRFRA